MGKLFGTDGIRGVANRPPMVPETALNIGRAVALSFSGTGGERPKIVVGRDTRLSGDMLESALVAGICSAGAEALLAGVIPTPGVAFLASETGCGAGIVISASHNPYQDNGIKIFNGEGFKLTDERESEIESLAVGGRITEICSERTETGRVHPMADASERYGRFLKRALPDGFGLRGRKIVLDASNGATYQVAPRLFSDLGAEVEALFVHPDGKNINDGCGSQHPGPLIERVKATGAGIGLAFDGDGDRLIAVDETGRVVSGDQILAICAGLMKAKGTLRNNTVVSTVMSNIGLGLALKEMGIAHLTADVGDRYVVEMMRSSGAVIGGEDSGHMIFLNHHTTGDGILTALKLVEAMAMTGKSLSRLADVMSVFPQELMNVEVRQKPDIGTLPEIREAVAAAEGELKERGRVLVRYSGTQPLCRIMVEGPTPEDTRRHCERITDVVRRTIGT